MNFLSLSAIRIRFLQAVLLFLIILSLFPFSVLAQEQSYDPSKEPPFDKDQAIKELKEVVTTQHAVHVNRYIIDKYLQTERFKAAIFILDSLKKIPQYDQRHFMENELCLCHYFIGEKEYGLKCIQDNYFATYYPKIDITELSQDKRYSLVREYNYDVIFILMKEGLTSFKDRRIIPFIEKLIDNFLANYKDITDSEKKSLISQKERFKENRELEALLDKRKELRRKQILDYIQELEKILVARDEKKLEKFLNKYIAPNMQKFFLERYLKRYFNKNYSEIHFELIADSRGESIHLTGFEEEITSVDYIVRTIPESKGKECPEVVHSDNQIELYCQGFINFSFKENNMYID